MNGREKEGGECYRERIEIGKELMKRKGEVKRGTVEGQVMQETER